MTKVKQRKSNFTPDELLAPEIYLRTNPGVEPIDEIYEKWIERMRELVRLFETGKQLTALEKHFFEFVASNNTDFNQYKNTSVCLDEKFKFQLYIYLDYTSTGISMVPRNGQMVRLSEAEINEVMNSIQSFIQDWENIVYIENHSNQTLQLVCSETRKELTTLRKKYAKSGLVQDAGYFQAREKTLLKSKSIFIKVSELIEEFPLINYQPTLNGSKIQFTEDSLVHIFFRHFMRSLQSVNLDKSFFTRDIDYNRLHEFTFNILTAIEESGTYQHQDLGEIQFRYKGIDSVIWTKHHNSIRWVSSFYTINDAGIKNRLQTKYNLVVINPELSVYIPN